MTSGQSYESLADLLQSGPLSSSTSPRKATGPSRRERYGAISSDPAPRFVRGSTATDVVHSDLTPISHMPTVPVSEIVLPKKVSTIKVIATLMSLFAATTLWSIEFAFGTPALLSLGLSRSSASLVWLAGPFTGTICQPLIGSLSDADHSNWRRRKYIVASFVLCIIFAFLVAFAQPVAHLILRYFSRIEDWDPKRHELSLKVAAFIAVPSFWGLDFALNALQAASRALLIDTVPGHQQPAANAWQGKMYVSAPSSSQPAKPLRRCQLGNVLGYGIGFTDLGNDKLLKHLPGGQFGRLIILASVISAFCVAITCFCIQEKPSEPSKSSTKKGQDAEEASALRVLKDIKAELRGLPTPLRRVCLVQFFSWIGWSV